MIRLRVVVAVMVSVVGRDPSEDRETIKNTDPEAMDLIQEFIFPNRNMIVVVRKYRKAYGKIQIWNVQPPNKFF